MDTGKNIGAGKFNPYSAEIDQYAQKTESGGTGLFVGHKIDWWKLGNEDDLGGRIWNYCKSCINPEYANAVRDAFWDAMKADAKELSGSYKAQNGGLDPDAVQRIEKTLTEIMESADLTKVQKMELVLKAVGENQDVQSLVKGAASGLALSKYKLSSTPKSLSAFAQYQEALDYFKTEKNKAVDAIDKVTTLGFTANYATDQDMINETGNVYNEEYREIKSLEELKEFQQAYAEARITVMVEVYDVPLGRALLADLERNVIKLLNENTDVVLSPEEKQDLIELVQIPRVMGAIDRLAQKTWKSDKAITRDLEGLRENFEGSLNDYLTSVVNIMVRGCAGDAENLAKVEGNVREFLAYEAEGIPGIEKKELLKLVQIPRMYPEEIKIINEGIATDDLITKIQAKNDLKNLGNIYERYTNEKPISREKMNEIKGDYLRETITEMMKIIGDDKESVDILKRNVEKLLKDPMINFSEKQKIEIRRELIVGSTDPKAKIDEIKRLLNEITEEKDISEGERMELILTAIGDNAEFKKIEKEDSISYFKEATEYFNSIKSIALAQSQSTLLTDMESDTTTSQEHGVLYNQLSKSLTPITTVEDELLKAASKKHTTFYNEIASNKDLQKNLAAITNAYNNKTIKSETEFIKIRMDYNKDIIKNVIAAWPSLNITSTKVLPERLGGTIEERTFKTESLPLDDMKNALNDNIKILAETSHPPLSQVEIDELEKLVLVEFEKHEKPTATNL